MANFRTFILLLCVLLLSSTVWCRHRRENEEESNPNDMELTTNEDELFDMHNVNWIDLLEVPFVNKSVQHYRSKAATLQANLKDRLDKMKQFSKQQSLFGYRSPEFEQKLNETLGGLIKSLELSPMCLTAFQHLRVELSNRRLWPLKFIDSMELLPTGLFEGVISSLGVWEECVNIASPEVKWNGIRGKYCLAKVELPFLKPVYHTDVEEYEARKAQFDRLKANFDDLNTKLKLMQMSNMFHKSYYRVGVCFPSTCTSAELQRAISKFFEPIQNIFNSSKTIIQIEDQCTVLEQTSTLDIYQKSAILIIGALSFLVFISTCYECFLNSRFCKTGPHARENPYKAYLCSFSALSNTNSLFDDLDSETDPRMNSIGAVVLGFVLMEMVGRSYVMPVMFGMMNIKRFSNGLPSQYFTLKKFMFIRSAIFAATTYVLAYTIILTINLCKGVREGKFRLTLRNFLLYAVARWLSLARRLIRPILLIYLLPLAGDGPLWHYFDQLYGEPCRRNLLPSLMFYSNYASSIEEVCNSPSMVVSALFYLSLLVPLVLLGLMKLKKQSTIFIAFVTSILIASIISLVPKLVFHMPVAPQEIAEFHSITETKAAFTHYLYATDQLLVPFFCGIVIGYLLSDCNKVKLGSKLTKTMIWAGMLALPIIAVEWNESFSPLHGHFSQFAFVSWLVLSKLMWSFGFGWIIFGAVSGVAASSSLRPFSRLAFGVFLNQITILSYRQLTKKELAPLNHVEILTDAIADIVIAFVVAYFIHILIEKPFAQWIRLVIQYSPPKVEETETIDQDNVEAQVQGNSKASEEKLNMEPLNGNGKPSYSNNKESLTKF